MARPPAPAGALGRRRPHPRRGPRRLPGQRPRYARLRVPRHAAAVAEYGGLVSPYFPRLIHQGVKEDTEGPGTEVIQVICKESVRQPISVRTADILYRPHSLPITFVTDYFFVLRDSVVRKPG